MATDDLSLFQEITRRIVAAADPVKVILFGSHARGSTHFDSDLDLLVIERDPVSTHQEAIRLRRLLTLGSSQRCRRKRQRRKSLGGVDILSRRFLGLLRTQVDEPIVLICPTVSDQARKYHRNDGNERS